MGAFFVELINRTLKDYKGIMMAVTIRRASIADERVAIPEGR
jgi:hypothetical protein